MYLIGSGVRYSFVLFQFLLLITEAGITEHIENSELFCILCSDSVCGFKYGNIENKRFPLRIDI